MSLATRLAGEGMRPASFLPAIKCSDCTQEIEIAAMGDHICGKAPPPPQAQPASVSNQFTVRQMNAMGQNPPSPLQPQQQQTQPAARAQTRLRAPTVTSSHGPAAKVARMAPPRINADAANKPFLAPRPTLPSTPISPAISHRSGSSNDSRPRMPRSATSPMPSMFDFRPPSPELTGNMDCAFPSFPTLNSTGSEGRPDTSSGRKTPTPSERAPSRTGSRQGTLLAVGKEQSGFETRSSMSDTGDVVRQRSNTLKGGPSDPNRDTPIERERIPQPMPMDRRRPSLSSIKLGHEPPPIPTEPLPRALTSHTNHTPLLLRPTTPGVQPESQPIQKRLPPLRPGRPGENVLSPRFLDRVGADPIVEIPSTFSPMEPPVPLRSADRSRTFPRRQESSDEPSPSQALQRTPSEPPAHTRGHRPTLTAGSISEPSAIPQVQTHSRSLSRTGRPVDPRPEDVPPVPNAIQQYRQDVAHTSSNSGSSTVSSLHSGNSTSGPSPIGSAASSVETFPTLSYEQAQYADEEKMRVAGLNVRAQQKPGMRAEQPAQRSPPRTVARPSAPQGHVQPIEREPMMPAVLSPPLESPMDPAMYNSRPGAANQEAWRWSPSQPQPQSNLSWTDAALKSEHREPAPLNARTIAPLAVPTPPQGDFDPYRHVSPQPASRTRSKSNAAQSHEAYNAGSSVGPLSPRPVPPPLPVPQQAPRAQPTTRRIVTRKPNCRGCGKMIEGKSVKAADGRLTGRWHKACFTCRACEQPFTTADFYVIDNQPYCEQHYHEKNGSLCHGCHRGIEGQYLETISSGQTEKKFHPRCFTCCDCRKVLSDDYFEISGKVFCERHALAAMRGQARMAGPGLNPHDRKAMTAERRTTKLMMM
ncbi:hypothetical protein LTR08_004539 [Meristemomyces frigidus]|nr:hypothetical protein LTR08_004539 [Meristemomyces frigidus]